ncbi:MAG: hypothetical protein DMG15_02335 [Acidobacteria bacterium]|nr:MAG: hypothetical protein DMG15_02335 [Acidobacteriota bacterium]
MIQRFDFGRAGVTYIETRMALAGGIWPRVQMGLDFGDEAFCFLPDSFVQAQKPICFLEDRIISPPQEIEAMEHREAEFFHSFLMRRENSALVIDLPYRQQELSPTPGFQLSLANGELLARRLHPTVEDVKALLRHVPSRQLICGLVSDADHLQSPESYEGVAVSAFDERAKLFALGRQPSRSGYVARTGSNDARVTFNDRAADYVDQRLCNSQWAPWVRSFRATGGTELWSIVPGNLPLPSGGAMAAKLANLQLDFNIAAVEEARHRVLSFIVGLLKEDKRNTALFGRSAHDAWTKTISVTMGPAAPWNDRVMTSRVLFNVVDSEDASMEAVISLWRPGMGTPPTCALLHNCEVLKPSRRAVDLTAAEVLEKLVPSTEHLSIGIYGNDLCLVWSKAGVGASIS